MSEYPIKLQWYSLSFYQYLEIIKVLSNKEHFNTTQPNHHSIKLDVFSRGQLITNFP